jgi:hypothetical protein
MAIIPRNRNNSNRPFNLQINNNGNNNNGNNNNGNNLGNNNTNNNMNNNLNTNNNNSNDDSEAKIQQMLSSGVFTNLEDLFNILKTKYTNAPNQLPNNFKVTNDILSTFLSLLFRKPTSEILQRFNKDEIEELYNYATALRMKRDKTNYYQSDLYMRITKLQSKLKAMNESDVNIPRLLPKIMAEYLKLYNDIPSSSSSGGKRKHKKTRKLRRSKQKNYSRRHQK